MENWEKGDYIVNCRRIRFVYHEYNWTNGNRTELDDMKSCYQLIKPMTTFEKESRHHSYVLIETNKQTNS